MLFNTFYFNVFFILFLFLIQTYLKKYFIRIDMDRLFNILLYISLKSNNCLIFWYGVKKSYQWFQAKTLASSWMFASSNIDTKSWFELMY